MIRGIHYFSTELKTGIDVIPRGCFNNPQNQTNERLSNLAEYRQEIKSYGYKS